MFFSRCTKKKKNCRISIKNSYGSFTRHASKVNILPNRSTTIKIGKLALIQYSYQIYRPDSEFTSHSTVSFFWSQIQWGITGCISPCVSLSLLRENTSSMFVFHKLDAFEKYWPIILQNDLQSVLSCVPVDFYYNSDPESLSEHLFGEASYVHLSHYK